MRRAAAVAGVEGDPAELLRDHLVDVAGTLLSERSVSSITTRELARAAGVSDGVLYNYFGDKNELLLTALVGRFRALVASFHAGVPAPGQHTVRANLVQLAHGLLELHLAGLPLFGKLAAQPALLGRFVHEIHRPDAGLSGREIRDAVVGYVQREQAGGRIGDCDAGAVADLLIGSVALHALLAVTAGAPAAERIPALVDTLVAGLAQPRRRSS
jgi:AcrR family transcriptional regulator